MARRYDDIRKHQANSEAPPFPGELTSDIERIMAAVDRAIAERDPALVPFLNEVAKLKDVEFARKLVDYVCHALKEQNE